MTSIVGTLSIVLAVLVAAIVALLALLWRRVGADRALRKSEAFFRHLADARPWSCGRHGQIDTRLPEQVQCRVHGNAPEGLVG